MSSVETIKKQIKFAVVMYGGGSLAIYINGVAQELLKMAQATNSPNNDFSGTTLIYRKIALLLSGNREAFDQVEKFQEEIAELSKNKTTSRNQAELENVRSQLQAELNKETTVEFIVDVLTGSSAGGINAVFLAKALVNGAKSMDDLQRLWLEQGDFAKLLNDRQSVTDNSLDVPKNPESLLNSQRMYLELLKALDGLDVQSDAAAACIKPTDLIDLYVTYTDFEGLPTNLVLSDKIVLERVHKRVFNFRYDDGRNDFESINNPFLAFAARCTSSFPIAFEPMCLKNIDEIIQTALPERDSEKSDCAKWMNYFSDVTDENGNPVDWKNRWFVDGGCLDNKPFGYAIDKLTQRTGEGIVERKLLYIEPKPESFRNTKNKGRKPNALENVFAQAAGLPSYETIREDLRRVIDRNRLIERVTRLTAEVEGDFDRNSDWLKIDADKSIDWSKADLNDVAKEKGSAFIPYYRLRVSSTTDEIARLVTRYFNINDDSDYFNVLRTLIRIWREETYQEYKSEKKADDINKENIKTFNEFLYQYDVEYRLRRLRFVLQKAEHMLRCKDEIEKALSDFAEGEVSPEFAEQPDRQIKQEKAALKIVDTKEGVLSAQAALFAALPGANEEEKRNSAANFNYKDYVEMIIQMQKELSCIYLQLRRETEFLKENLGSRNSAKTQSSAHMGATVTNGLTDFQKSLSEVEDELRNLETTVKERSRSNKPPAIAALDRILTQINLRKKMGCVEFRKADDTDILTTAYPDQDINPLIDSLKRAAATLDAGLFNNENTFLRRASRQAKSVLGIKDNRGESSQRFSGETSVSCTEKAFDNASIEAQFVRTYLRNYYELFDSYDQISYPLFFESSVGEAVKVDVIRISSRDATSLIDEEKEEKRGSLRRKLAGDYLFAFGAFLDPRWRLNDIMWGRLDGAERLITTLLHEAKFDDVRDALIDEANKLILAEMLMEKATESFQGTLVGALTLASTEAIEREAVDKLVLQLKSSAIQHGLTQALTTTLNKDVICTHVREEYEVNRRLEPEPTLRTISRSTQIIGKIMQDITEEQVQMGDRLSWIAKLGQIFWGVVTVAAPNSIWNSLFNYWVQLLYLFEAVMIVGATIFAKPDVQQFGIVSLIITLGIHLTVIALQEVMLGDNFWKTMLRFLVGSVLAAFVILGALFFYSIFFDDKLWGEIARFQGIVSKPEFERWQKLVPIVPFAVLFVVLALWRQAEKLNLALIGKALIAGFLAVIAFSVYFGELTGATRDFAPMIELEFVSDGKTLGEVISKLGNYVGGMKRALWLDSLGFVPLYCGFLLILSVLLKRRRHKWATAASACAALCAIFAAIADLAENYYSLFALNQTGGNLDRAAEWISFAAHSKWTLIFAALAILALIFWRSDWRNLWNIAALLMVLGAIIGIIGTFFYPLNFLSMPMVTVALILEFLILVTVGAAFQIGAVRQYFTRGY